MIEALVLERVYQAAFAALQYSFKGDKGTATSASMFPQPYPASRGQAKADDDACTSEPVHSARVVRQTADDANKKCLIADLPANFSARFEKGAPCLNFHSGVYGGCPRHIS
jgi:hypothetical protein